jgi:hypothetical protein
VKGILFGIVIVVAGLAGVMLSEALIALGFLEYAPYDVTGNLFLGAVLPAYVIVVGLTVLLLGRVFAYNLPLFATLYLLAFGALLVYYLISFFNPLPDIFKYLGCFVAACAFWFTLRWRALNTSRPA